MRIQSSWSCAMDRRTSSRTSGAWPAAAATRNSAIVQRGPMLLSYRDAEEGCCVPLRRLVLSIVPREALLFGRAPADAFGSFAIGSGGAFMPSIFHLPLPDATYESLRTAAERSKVPATA